MVLLAGVLMYLLLSLSILRVLSRVVATWRQWNKPTIMQVLNSHIALLRIRSQLRGIDRIWHFVLRYKSANMLRFHFMKVSETKLRRRIIMIIIGTAQATI